MCKSKDLSLYKQQKARSVENLLYFCGKFQIMPSKNPFAYKAKQQGKKKASGKRVGKSKPEKANNQLNRRVK